MSETKDRFAEWDFKSAHNLWLTNPADWRSNAEASFLSAQVLFDAMRQRGWQNGGIGGLVRTGHLESRYMLLMGLAFECLFKGLVVDHSRRAGEAIPKDLFGKDGHRTASLYAESLFGRSESEVALLKKLETFVVWAGRYAVPRRPKELEESIRTEGATDVSEEDIGLMNRMFEELIVKLEQPWPYERWEEYLRSKQPGV